MTTNTLDFMNQRNAITADMFKKAVHIIPLGWVQHFESSNHDRLTLSNRVGGKKRVDFWLKAESFVFLSTIDITVNNRKFSKREREMLEALAREGIVYLFHPEEDIRSLDLLMQPQKSTVKLADVDAGLRIWVEEDKFFDLSWLGERIARATSLHKPVGEVIRNIHEELLADTSAADFISDVELQSGKTFSRYLHDETLAQMEVLHKQNFLSFEPSLDHEVYEVDIFDNGPVFVVPIGSKIDFEDGSFQLSAAVGFGPTAADTTYNSVIFTAEHSFNALLKSIDPTVSDREFTKLEKALLWHMANWGYVSLVKDNGRFEEFDMIPVPRKTFFIKEILEEGYTVILGELLPDGTPAEDYVLKEATAENSFFISKLFGLIGGYIIQEPTLGTLTLGELLFDAEQEMLLDTEFMKTYERAAEGTELNFHDELFYEALMFIKQVRQLEVFSFEQGAITRNVNWKAVPPVFE